MIILSARNNFLQRQAIRTGWANESQYERWVYRIVFEILELSEVAIQNLRVDDDVIFKIITIIQFHSIQFIVTFQCEVILCDWSTLSCAPWWQNDTIQLWSMGAYIQRFAWICYMNYDFGLILQWIIGELTPRLYSRVILRTDPGCKQHWNLTGWSIFKFISFLRCAMLSSKENEMLHWIRLRLVQHMTLRTLVKSTIGSSRVSGFFARLPHKSNIKLILF